MKKKKSVYNDQNATVEGVVLASTPSRGSTGESALTNRAGVHIFIAMFYCISQIWSAGFLQMFQQFLNRVVLTPCHPILPSIAMQCAILIGIL